MDTFSFYYKRAHKASIKFNTSIQDQYSAHEKRIAQWTGSQSSWVLDFDKTPEAFTAVGAFFNAQKGKYKAFYWTWDATKGGDGNTYIVRFDTDQLDFNVDNSGFKTFSIPIVQTIP